MDHFLSRFSRDRESRQCLNWHFIWNQPLCRVTDLLSVDDSKLPRIHHHHHHRQHWPVDDSRLPGTRRCRAPLGRWSMATAEVWLHLRWEGKLGRGPKRKRGQASCGKCARIKHKSPLFLCNSLVSNSCKQFKCLRREIAGSLWRASPTSPKILRWFSGDFLKSPRFLNLKILGRFPKKSPAIARNPSLAILRRPSLLLVFWSPPHCVWSEPILPAICAIIPGWLPNSTFICIWIYICQRTNIKDNL